MTQAVVRALRPAREVPAAFLPVASVLREALLDGPAGMSPARPGVVALLDAAGLLANAELVRAVVDLDVDDDGMLVGADLDLAAAAYQALPGDDYAVPGGPAGYRVALSAGQRQVLAVVVAWSELAGELDYLHDPQLRAVTLAALRSWLDTASSCTPATAVVRAIGGAR
jgi:hypothetical protein